MLVHSWVPPRRLPPALYVHNSSGSDAIPLDPQPQNGMSSTLRPTPWISRNTIPPVKYAAMVTPSSQLPRAPTCLGLWGTPPVRPIAPGSASWQLLICPRRMSMRVSGWPRTSQRKHEFRVASPVGKLTTTLSSARFRRLGLGNCGAGIGGRRDDSWETLGDGLIGMADGLWEMEEWRV
jgi:hypothetical protein